MSMLETGGASTWGSSPGYAADKRRLVMTFMVSLLRTWRAYHTHLARKAQLLQAASAAVGGARARSVLAAWASEAKRLKAKAQAVHMAVVWHTERLVWCAWQGKAGDYWEVLAYIGLAWQLHGQSRHWLCDCGPTRHGHSSMHAPCAWSCRGAGCS